ncbi:MAG: hypothetical protein F4110_07255 [Acidimicrobiaceae bacterium]|nr:hypothetical protein [Acidimicrobiaceae bacterium]MYA00008.1 hypothetical protein [Acidimicrobiaceae bacterium]MYE77263.1 hypothetical protein [Acidimicrobiaceae bacterium]MYH44211.1 hypothetical protein [Acidimicrobiaceae bacterium]MYI53760.1 hypothetical protein [Acidimicrobiaceae bacterium]
MPTLEVPFVDGLIVLNVAIAPRGREEPERGFRAILDTGTQLTAISPRVVAAIKPDAVGEIQLRVADGSERWADQYWIRIRVPLGLSATAEAPAYDTVATQIPTSLEGCDVLLGMDIISKWHVTLSGGRCRIEF